jgi:hypothetical protein
MLYDPILTIIFVGDTNIGKTTTINNFFKGFTGLNSDFYATSGQNKTKRTTIFHLGSDNYKMIYKENVRVYESFDELLNEYNDCNKNGVICNDCYDMCHVFIKDGNFKINIIDTVGKSDKVSSVFHDEMMQLLNNDFPNNIYMNLIRNPSRDLYFDGNVFNVLTFADVIDYIKDVTLEDTHFNFINEIENNRLLFFSNSEDQSKKIIKNKEITFYGKDSILALFYIIFQTSKKQLEIPTLKLDDITNDSVLQNANCITEIVTKLSEYNNKNVSDVAINFINKQQFVSKNYMLGMFHDAINERETIRIMPGYGLVKSMQIFRAHFEKKCDSSVFSQEIINKCDEFMRENKHKSISKSFKIFDTMVKNKINILSKQFTDLLLSQIFEESVKILSVNTILNDDAQNTKKRKITC